MSHASARVDDSSAVHRRALTSDMVLHDLTNATTTMVAAAHTLRNGFDHLPRADLLRLVDLLVLRGESVLQLTRDANRAAGGGTGLEIHPGAAPLRDVVLRTVEMSGVRSVVEVTVSVPSSAWIHCDEHRLRQALTNLLTNAVRYGGRRVWIDATRQRGHTVLLVSDDGPGIEADVVDAVFDERVRGSESNNLGGSGLGLTIVRAIAEAMGGWVRHVEDRDGAQFALAMPTTGDPSRDAQRPLSPDPGVAAPFDHACLRADGEDHGAWIGEWVRRGLAADETVMLIAPRPALRDVAEHLGDVQHARLTGRLTEVEADWLLEQFWHPGGLDHRMFAASTGALVRDALTRTGRLRVYADLAGAVAERAGPSGIPALEGAWNGLLGRHWFQLVCAPAPTTIGAGAHTESVHGRGVGSTAAR